VVVAEVKIDVLGV